MVDSLLVVGANGQLARAFKQLRPDAQFLDRSMADLAFPNMLSDALAQYNPSVLINAAAYTQVDKAESEEERATKINGESVAVMAEFCAHRKIPLVTFSTDYVFDGSGQKPWTELDSPAPLNAYGRSKLAGEKALELSACNYLLFRTSWVYDAEGKNFVNTILRLSCEREELRIVDDQIGAPTYAPHLAKATLNALENAANETFFPTGIYHLCNSGLTTWHGFATAIVEQAKRMGFPIKVHTIHPIPTKEYPVPASRPLNSRLDCSKALSMLGISLPDWQEGLIACMELKRENH